MSENAPQRPSSIDATHLVLDGSRNYTVWYHQVVLRFIPIGFLEFNVDVSEIVPESGKQDSIIRRGIGHRVGKGVSKLSGDEIRAHWPKVNESFSEQYSSWVSYNVRARNIIFESLSPTVRRSVDLRFNYAKQILDFLRDNYAPEFRAFDVKLPAAAIDQPAMATSEPPDELEVLKQKAIEAKDTAYCPYSNFRVGACFLSSEGAYFSGANVENASYPVGICAERCALAAAVASFKRPLVPKFKALAVATDIAPAVSPCGMCRQFIREFCPPTMPIYMLDKDGNSEDKTLGDLLPMAFGPQQPGT